MSLKCYYYDRKVAGPHIYICVGFAKKEVFRFFSLAGEEYGKCKEIVWNIMSIIYLWVLQVY